MARRLASNWWVLALRGLVAIAFGVVAFVRPDITADVLIILFGVYALVDGVFMVAAALVSHGARWWALLLVGLAGIAAGILAFLSPAVVAISFVYLFAGWAIATGIFEIVAAIRLRHEIEGEFWLGLSGVLSVLFGLYLVINPVVLIWLIGAYAIMFGLLLLALAFRLRAWHQGMAELRTP